MTVKITNGPGKVRIRHRNVSRSARGVDSDNHEQILAKGESTQGHDCVYDGRKLIIEEVDE